MSSPGVVAAAIDEAALLQALRRVRDAVASARSKKGKRHNRDEATEGVLDGSDGALLRDQMHNPGPGHADGGDRRLTASEEEPTSPPPCVAAARLLNQEFLRVQEAHFASGLNSSAASTANNEAAVFSMPSNKLIRQLVDALDVPHKLSGGRQLALEAGSCLAIVATLWARQGWAAMIALFPAVESMKLAFLLASIFPVASRGASAGADRAADNSQRPVLYESSSAIQSMKVLGDPLVLLLNNEIQFHAEDELVHHEVFALRTLVLAPLLEHILVLGGGDGLIARECLRYPDVRITLVELDQNMIDATRGLCMQMKALSENSFLNDRCHVVCDDCVSFVHAAVARGDSVFDSVILDAELFHSSQPNEVTLTVFHRFVSACLELVALKNGTVCVCVPCTQESLAFLTSADDVLASSGAESDSSDSDETFSVEQLFLATEKFMRGIASAYGVPASMALVPTPYVDWHMYWVLGGNGRVVRAPPPGCKWISQEWCETSMVSNRTYFE